jgi:crotonobetainyl-CoA:carnitine CoA-transferase CaiB-like acyl-CoA transferase
MLVMAALLKRRRTGEGCYIDVSQTEVGLMTSGTATLEAQVTGEHTARYGNRTRGAAWAPHGAYPCRGKDEWIAISIQNDAQWSALAAAIGSPEWTARFAAAAQRKAHEDELDRHLAGYTQDQERYDLMDRLQHRRVPAAAVQTAADRVERDPQLQSRGYFVRVPHSEIGTWPIEGFPAKFAAMRVEVGGLPGRGAPVMGEDNDYVYRELLGLQPDEIATLKEELVI